MPETTVHERKLIRDAVVDALLARSVVATGHVFKGRRTPLRRDELPGINVYTESESADDQETAPRELTREMTLILEGFVSLAGDEVEDLDSTLDALALAIEFAMDGDEDLQEVVGDIVLASTELGEAVDGNRPVGVVRLEYKVTYHTDLRSTGAGFSDPLQTVTTQTNVGGIDQDTDDAAHDEVDDLYTGGV